MWLVAVIPWLALTAPEVAAPTQAPGQWMTEPIVTRQTVFTIPFQLQQGNDPATEPVEVQLYVSTDHSAHWRLYSKVPPSQKQFLFRSGGDGEYWYLVRTLNRAGQMWPKWSNTPELRVIVDTSPPTLQLKAWRGPAGQLTARWEVTESRLRPDPISLQYRTSTTQPWQPVAIGASNFRITGSTQTGEVTWWPGTTSGLVQVRAEVADTGGNIAVSHAQVDLTSGVAEAARRQTPPVLPASNSTPQPDRKAQTVAIPPLTTPDPKTGAPVLVAPAVNSLAAPNSAAPTSVPMGINPPLQSDYNPTPSSNAAPATLPNGQRPRMVNTRVFELEYDVASVGPSGIGRIELWGTRDNGQTWQRYSLTDGNRGPLLVKVDEEGIYGFRLVVRSGAGLGGEPPKPGEQPDAWIGVDLSKPNVRITSIRQGTGEQANHLFIAWDASDNMLADRPISLYFSDNYRGPWTNIAIGLPNSGRYDWLIDSRVPQQVFIRLEARDEAGNVGLCDSPDPVTLDQIRPTIRIRDVHPVGQLDRRSGQYR